MPLPELDHYVRNLPEGDVRAGKPSGRSDRFVCYRTLLVSLRRGIECHRILAPTSRMVLGREEN